ncbi:TPA: LuxR C-terminal-related transcriptional regulator [Serratia fonticola]
MINVKFTLLDDNLFYRQGLFYILQGYIHSLNQYYRLYPQQAPVVLTLLGSIEIVFRSQDESWGCANCYQSAYLTPHHRQIMVMILDRQDKYQENYPEQFCINRQDSIDSVRQTLQMIIERFCQRSGAPLRGNSQRKCQRCQLAELSQCEKQVLKMMSTGMPATAIANKLQRSEKTISTHKRSAMRKLHIKKNTELNKLLLKQNGLVSLGAVAHCQEWFTEK